MQPSHFKHTNPGKYLMTVTRIEYNFNTFYRLLCISVDVTIKYFPLRWRLTNDIDVTIYLFIHFYLFKGLRRQQAVLQHSEHQKQL